MTAERTLPTTTCCCRTEGVDEEKPSMWFCFYREAQNNFRRSKQTLTTPTTPHCNASYEEVRQGQASVKGPRQEEEGGVCEEAQSPGTSRDEGSFGVGEEGLFRCPGRQYRRS